MSQIKITINLGKAELRQNYLKNSLTLENLHIYSFILNLEHLLSISEFLLIKKKSKTKSEYTCKNGNV